MPRTSLTRLDEKDRDKIAAAVRSRTTSAGFGACVRHGWHGRGVVRRIPSRKTHEAVDCRVRDFLAFSFSDLRRFRRDLLKFGRVARRTRRDTGLGLFQRAGAQTFP